MRESNKSPNNPTKTPPNPFINSTTIYSIEQDAIKFLSTRVLGRSKTFTQEELVKLLVDFKATGLNYSPEVLNDLLESSYDTGYLEGLRDGKISIQR